MPTIALVTDLIFSTKITSTGKAVGNPLLVARTLDKLREHLDAAGAAPVTLLVDLNSANVDPLAAITLAKAHPAAPRVIAFLSHVQVDLAAAARTAGADQVMARSAFSAQLPALLSPPPAS